MSASRLFRHLARVGPRALKLAGGASLLLLPTAFCAPASAQTTNVAPVSATVDYSKVYSDIAAVLDDLDYDDGSFGPVLVRLAWHAAGTYDKASGTGGSNGSTMRFKPESAWGANAGLAVARERLDAIKAKYPGLTYADLWSLAGVVAIQEAGGPLIPWRAGRSDAPHGHCCPPDGRLPDAGKKGDHLRDIFYRMGFNDQEIVALAGAHALGRCHTDRSGYSGPWTRAPTTFSNAYFSLLLSETWTPKAWAGPLQYEDAATKELMMLPADLALIQDADFKPFVELYARDSDRFFADFASAFGKLLELGVPFPAGSAPRTFPKAA